MSRKSKSSPKQRQALSFQDCLRKFLTPQLFKQAHQAHSKTHYHCRWNLQPLLLVLLTLTWCTGDSQAERFETARAFCITLTPKRRRPGKTPQGFFKALARLPMPVLRGVASSLRGIFLPLFAPVLACDGWLPFGCDGSRLECPRSAELEQRLGQAGKDDSAPTIWVTAFVHLTTGLLWSWWLGKGTASERDHLQRLVPTLPAGALVVADAGYVGFDLSKALMEVPVSFLIRLSSTVRLYTTEGQELETWREGEVYYWPGKEQKAQRPPLALRLLRVRSPERKVDVWLLTNVMESERLSVETAGKFYKMRWANEGLFRTYKRTLRKVKLQSHSVALLHREAEGSLLALQLLLAQGTWGLAVVARARSAACSPRAVLREIRKEIVGRRTRGQGSYAQRLSRTGREQRLRKSSKEKRAWPRRKPHKPPNPPKILKLSDAQKALLYKVLNAAKAAKP
jgi:hypothetical protein